MNGIRNLAMAAVMTGALAGSARAQACKVNEGGNFQLTSGRIYVNKAYEKNAKVDERPTHLRNAVKVLTENAEKISNPVGRHMLLGKALYFWTREPNISHQPLRGTLGYTTNTNQPQDLLAAIDTSFDFVEAQIPACADSLRIFRRVLVVQALNAGIELINANQLDSATKLIERSLVIFPNSANAYNALNVIAAKKGDTTAMANTARKVLEVTKGDTSAAIKKLRLTATYNLAVQLIGRGEAGAADKPALFAEARQLLQSYLAEVPGDPNAQQALARIATASGDTTAVAAIYADMMSNPSKFTDIQLFEAGSALAMAKKYDDAVKLYEAGLQSNPYYRDALFNLATVYFERKEYDRMVPIATRLVQIDPSNPDNWRQLAAAYQGMMRTAKDPKVKKAHQDTLLKYLSKSDSMPVKVSFSDFRHAGAKHTLQGMVENRGKKPGTYTLKIEFVDRQGTVVSTEQAVVGPVAPNQSVPFTVTTEKTGIAAFRYAPIT